MILMASSLRYLAASCQTNFSNPTNRKGIIDHTNEMIAMIDRAVIAYGPFGTVRLVVFPEFAHAAPIYDNVPELLDKLAISIPNEHTERYQAKAKELKIYIQTGSFIEKDSDYPNHVFNTTCLIGPDGILYKYRKVNPWIPWEVHSSPHDIPDYKEPLFPVAETEIGNIGTAICYDWIFPETIRELALNGAEVFVRVSAYMDPWGATPPMDWWTVVNRCRALENIGYVVASNQGAELHNYPPFSWPGGSMIVDYDGRILAQADAGPGQKIVVAPIDIEALRDERDRRMGHHMLSHLRTEAYPSSRRPIYPGSQSGKGPISIESTNKAIKAGKKRYRGG
jgi:predicted amidohydrolase